MSTSAPPRDSAPAGARTTSQNEIYLARQAIYDRHLNCVAYELLFRSGATDRSNVLDGNRATSQVIVNTFMEMGLDAIVGSRRAFINVTRDFILGDYALVFPAPRVAMEILEDIPIDDELLHAVRQRRSQGYMIVLDDVVYRPELDPLLELADMVKIEVLGLDRCAVERQCHLFRPFRVQMLAEKVETESEFRSAVDLGFQYFQGFFFSRPNLVRGRRMPLNRVAALRLLERVNDIRVDIAELEAIINQDVSLSYRLLRSVNSAVFHFNRRIESVRQALMLLGTNYVANWVSLIVLSGISDKPRELVVTAAVRARMCRTLGHLFGVASEESCFTAGMFSTLDALFDQTLEEVLRPLPLKVELVEAILAHKGSVGRVLHGVLAYEHGDWGEADLAGISPDAIRSAYLDAVQWASGLLNHLAES